MSAAGMLPKWNERLQLTNRSACNLPAKEASSMEDCRLGGPRASGDIAERRSEFRKTSILRLALIDSNGCTQLCRITNISHQGVQATVFGSVAVDSEVSIRVPDEITLEGSIVWVRDRSVGIKLGTPLAHSTLLRFTGERRESGRRRRSPRLQISAPACLRSGGRTYAVDLVDISPSGAMVSTTRQLPGLGPIVLDALGLPKIAGQIRWLGDLRAGILFNEPVPLETLTAWLHRLYADDEVKGRFADGAVDGEDSMTEDCTSIAS